MTARRLYDDNLYRFDAAEPSYWEATAGDLEIAAPPVDSDDDVEIAIIGGGYTGLSAAYHLAKHHDIRATVLEAGHIGWGASGRNGGFCSPGGTSLGLERQIRRYGLEDTRRFYRAQVEAVELCRSLIADENIDTPVQGDGELYVAYSRKSFDHVRAYAQRCSRLLGMDAEVFSADEFRERFFDSTEQFGASRVRPTFGLHPLRFAKGLAQAAGNAGARLHARSEVLEWTRADGRHHLVTKGGTIRASRVVMATNGFMPEHLHPAFRARPLPLISAIVVTRPLSDEELAAHRWQTESCAISSRDLLDYFRLLPDRRLMFGGRGDATGSADSAERNFAKLTARLRKLWPHWDDVSIDYRWHGLICLTFKLSPCIGRLDEDPSVFFGFGYHGNGVNNSVWTGRELAGWLATAGRDGGDYPDTLPLVMRGLARRFPLPSLRLRYVQARIAMFRLTDWLAER